MPKGARLAACQITATNFGYSLGNVGIVRAVTVAASESIGMELSHWQRHYLHFFAGPTLDFLHATIVAIHV